MLHEKITLPRTGVILETYLADEKSLKQSIKRPFPHRPLVLVFPGGGYHFLSDREAEPVALRLLSLGIQAVVVRYSVAPARYPVALEQAAEAMQYAREHAEQWLCDSRKIAVMGFSAGGHAAAHLGTRWHEMGFDPACRPERDDPQLSCNHLGRVCASQFLQVPAGRARGGAQGCGVA